MKYFDIHWWLYQIDKLLKKPNVNNGFIPYKPTGTDEIHREGKETSYLGASKDVLLPIGDWRTYRPSGEAQARNGNETMSCVSQSACNAIETLINYYWFLDRTNQANEEQKELVKIFLGFGILQKIGDKYEANFSDRYIAKLSGTTYRGNSQDKVANAIRKYGLVAEELWPWVDGWDNYYSAVLPEVIAKGQEFLEYIDITYEWAAPAIFKDSLRYASLQTSVYAWNGTDGGVFTRTSLPKNHATVRDGYINNRVQVFDSYDPFGKETTRDFNFGYDMLFHFHLKKKLTTNDNSMATNVKILKDKNSAQVGFYLPQTNEDAMISIAKNFDIQLPLKDGKLDWAVIDIAGEFELK